MSVLREREAERERERNGDGVASCVCCSFFCCLFFSLLVEQVGLPPILAAACMGLSSTSVIVSSLWLKRYRKPVLVHGEDSSGPTHARPQALAKLMGAVGGTRRARGAAGRQGYDAMSQSQQDDSEGDDFTTLAIDSAEDPEQGGGGTPNMNEHVGLEMPASAAMTAATSSKRQQTMQALGPTRLPPRVKLLPTSNPRRVPLGSPLLPIPLSPTDALSDGDDGTPRASNYSAPSPSAQIA